MKTYNELTVEQRQHAVVYQINKLLEGIISGEVRFSDEKNNDDLQARIDVALQKADDMRTPWFAHEYVMDTCKDDIEGMAQCSAEDCVYMEDHEEAVHIRSL